MNGATQTMGAAPPEPGAAFRRLWHATAASALGNGIQRALVPLMAALASRDPVVVGWVIACGRLPWLVLGVHTGRWIDRFTPGRVAAVGATVRVLGATLLTVFWIGPWQATGLLCALVFVVAAGEVLGDVAAQTWVAHLAKPDAYPVANARIYGTQVLLGQLTGPALAGFLLAIAAPFATGAAALLQALAAIGLRRVTVGQGAAVAPPVVAGSAWALVRADRCLLGIVALGALSMGIYGMWTTAFVLFVTDPQGLDLPATGYGLLMAIAAAGSLAGTLVMPRMLRATNGLVCVRASCVGVSLLALGPACSRSVLAAAASLAAYGLLLSAWNVSAVSFRQRRVPIGMLGRVTAFYRLAAWGAMPIGAGLGGVLCAHGGAQPVFWACVALSLVQYPLWRLVRELRGYRG